MAIRPILSIPDPVLREKSTPIAKVDDGVRALAADMLDTMYDAPGIGLAAIQIGVPKRLLVIDVAKKDEPKQPQIFINPVIIEQSKEKAVYEEGCLSIPEQYAEVERPSEVRVRWLGLDGNIHEEHFTGLWATCAQHEMDHLDGKLFIDYLSPLKRQLITRKMEKLKRDRARGIE